MLPCCNQVEISPFAQRTDLQQYCGPEGIVLTAYSPLTRGKKLADERVVKMASKVCQ